MVTTRSVLIAEDSGLIALALEGDLSAAGYVIAGAFPTCSAALDWLRDNSPDLALLDYSLRDGACIRIAGELRRLDVPFVILSGHARHTIELHPDLEGAPWIEKPASAEVILQALVNLTPVQADSSSAVR